MQFTVKYRSPKGSIVDEVVEAENRGECLAICKQRGITPLSVKEGKSSALNSKRQIANSSAKIIKWIVALTALAAIGIVAWLMLSSVNKKHEGTVRQEEKTKPKITPTENKPKPVKKEQSVTSDSKKKNKNNVSKERPPQRVGEIRDGYRLLCDGSLHRVLGVVTNTPGKFSLADKTFTHSADIELGNLLMIEPGEDLLGDSAGMYKGFNKEFDTALTEPIEYNENDTPLQRQIKDAVKEMREELKARRSKGEDIEKIMEDTRNQLKELSLYREELANEVRRLSTDNLTQKDYEDLLKAANEMLKERGIKPLEMPSTLRHTIRLRKIQEDAAAKAKKGNTNENKK